MAKIVSIIPNEPKGRDVDLDGTIYQFRPETAHGPNVCEVTNPVHVAKLLAITEGYAPAGGVKKAVAPVPADEDPFAKTKDVMEPDDEPQAPKKTDQSQKNGLTRKQLEAAYKTKFDKKPPANMRDDTIAAKLAG